MKRIHLAIFSLALSSTLAISGCKDYLDLPLPLNNIAGSSAFTTDKSCAAVLNDIYIQLTTNGENSVDGAGFGFRTGLYTDELMSIGAASSGERPYYQSSVQNSNTKGLWSVLYNMVYASNLAIEGVSQANKANVKSKDQWLGEAYFMRALLHFYITSLYGDAVIATTSDYLVINTLPRSPQTLVYQQIVKDLQQAQSLLSDDYKNNNGAAITTERARPNKAAATALLARVYLYMKEWQNAETQASQVIAQTSVFSLPQPADVFLKGSREIIYSIAPIASSWVKDYNTYNNGMPDTVPNFPANSVNIAMSNGLSNAFEPGDKRLAAWTRTSTSRTNPVTYRFPNKYRSRTNGIEFIVVLRLAEQYLVRAEARAQLNRITGANSAKEDLDAVRTRAGLTGTTATTQPAMLDAIMQERRVELFTEQGHRLYDLRRTDRLTAVMTPLVPQKGGVEWKAYMQYWPINPDDVFANPAIKQTEGYQ